MSLPPCCFQIRHIILFWKEIIGYPCRKTTQSTVLMTLLQQPALTLPHGTGTYPSSALCTLTIHSSVALMKRNDASRIVDLDRAQMWMEFKHDAKYGSDLFAGERGLRGAVSRRRITHPPQWTLVLVLHLQTTCFCRTLIDTPPRINQAQVQAGRDMSRS
uniref:Uncharacterized protein n=1 Tax=Scleropages formosus TaxID=113540 RepID=A0A8C9WIE4_SCLFO